MNRLGLAPFALFALASCMNFDAAYEDCQQPGGRCFDAGASGGGGGGSTGGGSGGSLGGGTGGDATGGGSGGGSVGGGTGGDATGGGSGGGSVGGGTGGGAAGGGTGGTGGTGGGTGCQGCMFLGSCLDYASQTDQYCGANGASCTNCLPQGKTCSFSTHTCQSPPPQWTFVSTQYNHDALWGVCAVAPGEAYFSGLRTTAFLHTTNGGASFQEYYLAGNGGWAATSATNGGATIIYVAGVWSSQGVVTAVPHPWDGGSSPGPRYLEPAALSFNTVFTAGSDVFVAGGTSTSMMIVFRKTGPSTWVQVTPSAAAAEVWDGWGPSTGDYYVVTRNKALGHRTSDGGYSELTLPGQAYAVWGTSPSRVYVAGPGGFVARVDGTVVTPLDAGLPAVTWNSLWAADDGNVFVVGADSTCGRIATWDGASFSSRCLSPSSLVGITGTSPTDVWATDSDGGIWHLGP